MDRSHTTLHYTHVQRARCLLERISHDRLFAARRSSHSSSRRRSPSVSIVASGSTAQGDCCRARTGTLKRLETR